MNLADEPDWAIAQEDFHFVIGIVSQRIESAGTVEGSAWSGAVSALMLVCAVLASLAFGVLVAYGICQVMFNVFRVQSIAAAQQREMRRAAAGVGMAVEG